MTAIRNKHDMLQLHIIDSASIVPYIKGKHHIDVGTGGGLPGVVLAILYPRKNFTLLDSNGKKTRFLLQVKQILGLTNLKVVHSRVEKYRPENLFDSVISRAFSSIKDMLDKTQHLCDQHGCFLAMKANTASAELEKVSAEYSYEIHTIDLPDNEAKRCLVELRHL